MDPIDQVAARIAIHDLVVRAARGVDRGDAAMVASAFHADADVLSGVVDGKAPDYAVGVVALVRETFERCFHSLGTPYVEIDGDGARGETTVIAQLVTRAEPRQQTLTGGRYLDRFARRDGRWAIAERTFVLDWTSTQAAPAEPDGPRGGWAPDDPSVAFWRRSG